MLDILVCPACGGRLAVTIFQRKQQAIPSIYFSHTKCSHYCAANDVELSLSPSARDFDCKGCYEDEIITGLLVCDCSNVFPILRGVPRIFPSALNYFLRDLAPWREKINALLPRSVEELLSDRITKEVDQVRKRFEFQWKKWGRGKHIYGRTKEQMLEWLAVKAAGSKIDTSFYPGKLVLDAGCGHGRYTECFQEFGAEVIGMDLGEGVDIAYEDSGHRPLEHFIQADILSAPFRKEIFDLVFSMGVLHHTPDAHAAFDKLAGLVAKRGMIRIWVFPKEGILWELSQKTIRSITTRLPPALLYPLCFLPVPLLKLKFSSAYSCTNLSNCSWKECAQVVWDWYSPKYQSHHTREEVKGWFEAASFSDLEFLPTTGVHLIGRKE